MNNQMKSLSSFPLQSSDGEEYLHQRLDVRLEIDRIIRKEEQKKLHQVANEEDIQFVQKRTIPTFTIETHYIIIKNVYKLDKFENKKKTM